jgi:hypothetical protein
MDGPKEALVILEQSAAGSDRDSARSQFKVTQAISDRVFLVDAASADLELLRRLPGTARVLTATVSPDELGELNETERLFVAAWAERQKPKMTPRKGEGAQWDAPGFQAP